MQKAKVPAIGLLIGGILNTALAKSEKSGAELEPFQTINWFNQVFFTFNLRKDKRKSIKLQQL